MLDLLGGCEVDGGAKELHMSHACMPEWPDMPTDDAIVCTHRCTVSDPIVAIHQAQRIRHGAAALLLS